MLHSGQGRSGSTIFTIQDLTPFLLSSGEDLDMLSSLMFIHLNNVHTDLFSVDPEAFNCGLSFIKRCGHGKAKM